MEGKKCIAVTLIAMVVLFYPVAGVDAGFSDWLWWLNPGGSFSDRVVSGQGGTTSSSSSYSTAGPIAYYVDPLTLSNACSLVSTRSVTAGGEIPQISTAAIFTVLEAPAPYGAFRPAYSDTDKTIRHNAGTLNYTLLRNLAPVGSTPALETVASRLKRPWLDHQGGWVGRIHHPVENMPDYGREIATRIGEGALMLYVDFPPEPKAKLLHGYVQLGIDLYGIATW